jgi:hypothetical protein
MLGIAESQPFQLVSRFVNAPEREWLNAPLNTIESTTIETAASMKVSMGFTLFSGRNDRTNSQKSWQECRRKQNIKFKQRLG